MAEKQKPLKRGTRVRFTCWSGPGGPDDTALWTGEIIATPGDLGVHQYLILRDHDGQTNVCSKKDIHPLEVKPPLSVDHGDENADWTKRRRGDGKP